MPFLAWRLRQGFALVALIGIELNTQTRPVSASECWDKRHAAYHASFLTLIEHSWKGYFDHSVKYFIMCISVLCSKS